MISSDPLFKYGNARFISVTLKASSEKLDIHVFVIVNCLCSFAGSLQKTNREIIRIKQFSSL